MTADMTGPLRCHECDAPLPVALTVAQQHHRTAIDALSDAATLTDTRDPRAAARAFHTAADHLELSNEALGLADDHQTAST